MTQIALTALRVVAEWLIDCEKYSTKISEYSDIVHTTAHEESLLAAIVKKHDENQTLAIRQITFYFEDHLLESFEESDKNRVFRLLKIKGISIANCGYITRTTNGRSFIPLSIRVKRSTASDTDWKLPLLHSLSGIAGHYGGSLLSTERMSREELCKKFYEATSEDHELLSIILRVRSECYFPFGFSDEILKETFGLRRDFNYFSVNFRTLSRLTAVHGIHMQLSPAPLSAKRIDSDDLNNINMVIGFVEKRSDIIFVLSHN